MTCRLCQGREQRRGFLVEGWYSSYFCCPTKRGRVSLKCRLFHHGYLFALSWQSCDPVTFDVYCHFVPSQANPRLGGSLLYQKKHKTIRLQTRLDHFYYMLIVKKQVHSREIWFWICNWMELFQGKVCLFFAGVGFGFYTIISYRFYDSENIVRTWSN